MSRRKPATIAPDAPTEPRVGSTAPASLEPAQASVERVSIDSLHVDPGNTRLHDERNKSTIRASLARFGAGRSIVLDRNNVVRAGNGTLEQARQAGFDEVLVVEPKPNQLVAVKRPDWSDTEATAYSVQDNRSTDLSSNDDAALAAVLEAVRNGDAGLLEATGYTGDEVDAPLQGLADDALGGGETGIPPEDAPVTGQFGVIVMCRDETEQKTVYDRLAAEGLNCKVVCV